MHCDFAMTTSVNTIDEIDSVVHPFALSNNDSSQQGSKLTAVHPEEVELITAPMNTSATSTPSLKWERRKIVALYLVTVTILFSDMNLLAPNLTTIADEFGFDEDERDVKLGGMIALGFFFVGAPVSFIVGWLADSFNRTPLFAVTVFVGEIGCLMSYFVKTYPQLYICRVLTGISIGGAIPVVFSVLGDLYPASQRSVIAAVVSVGTGLGMGVGQVIAGSMNDWRLPFLIVSIPGLLCSFLVLFIRDPPRGANEAAVIETIEERRHDFTAESISHMNEQIPATSTSYDRVKRSSNDGNDNSNNACVSRLEEAWVPEDRYATVATVTTVTSNHVNDVSSETIVKFMSCRSTLELVKIPSVILLILQAAPSALPFGFCATFLNDYLQQERGLTKEEATGVLLTFGAGNAVGVILGGFLGCSYKRDVRGPSFFMGISLILGAIPFYFLINFVDESINVSITALIAALSGVLVVIPVPLERSILTNVCHPQWRGRANALVSIVDDLGKGLGPALVSLLITTFDRQSAFNISLIGWIIGGILSLMIMVFVKKDEERLQQQLREQLSRQQT